MVHAFDLSQKHPHKFLTSIFCQLSCRVIESDKLLAKIKRRKKKTQYL